MVCILYLVVIIFFSDIANSFFVPKNSSRKLIHSSRKSIPQNEPVGKPLLLTPLLEQGKFKEAQTLSKVKPDIGNITSYSGFFTVNKACESNLFFWFFPALKDDWKEAPLLLWLQGGPGASSMYGLFEELGPLESYKEGLKRRLYSWNVENNLIIIDQPVGVGYSFTGQKCYPENETAVGEDLYQAVLQFHQLFPHLARNKFIISGESYAGHYIPALGHAIHKYNPSAKVKINLSAMLIGDGWVDPLTQSDYASYLYQHGLIDDVQKAVYENYQDQCYKEIAAQDWAGVSCDAFMDHLYSSFVGMNVSVYNYFPLVQREPQNWEEFIQTSPIRKALHVGDLPFHEFSDPVADSLRLDVMQSVKQWVEDLLESYPIIFYNGQQDIICAYPMTINFIKSLAWIGQDKYLSAKRAKWCVEDVSTVL